MNRRAGAALGKLGWEPMHDQVYERLREALMLSRFEPGSRLSLREVADQLDVSVMPVRVAMLRLVAEKALEQSATGKFIVPPVDLDAFDEAMSLRADLEGKAAALAARRRTEADLATLAAIAGKLRSAARRGVADQYLAHNRAFKFAVLDAARNRTLRDLAETLWVRVGPILHHYSRDIRHQLEIDEEQTILDAIARGAADDAEAAMRRDILEGASFLRQIILGKATSAER